MALNYLRQTRATPAKLIKVPKTMRNEGRRRSMTATMGMMKMGCIAMRMAATPASVYKNDNYRQ